jgi:hypothetical protein
MAELFRDIFDEPEFKNRFAIVLFAILSDHNSWRKHNPQLAKAQSTR